MENKDAGLRIRIERELRDEFVGACRKAGKPAAQVLREFMRTYIAKQSTQAVRRDYRKAGGAV